MRYFYLGVQLIAGMMCRIEVGLDGGSRQDMVEGWMGRYGADVGRLGRDILALWFCLRGKVWLELAEMKCGWIGAVLLV